MFRIDRTAPTTYTLRLGAAVIARGSLADMIALHRQFTPRRIATRPALRLVYSRAA